MYGANISRGFVWQFPPFAVSLGTKSVKDMEMTKSELKQLVGARSDGSVAKENVSDDLKEKWHIVKEVYGVK